MLQPVTLSKKFFHRMGFTIVIIYHGPRLSTTQGSIVREEPEVTRSQTGSRD